MIARVESAARMRGLAAALGELVEPGDVIALVGDLGAGKTEFVKGLAEGMGVPGDPVTSPTFTILQTYDEGRVRLHHVDLYRLEEREELMHIGLDDLFRDDAVVAVEWLDRFPDAVPRDRVEIAIAIVEGEARTVTATPRGERAERLVAGWRERAGGA